MPDEAGQQRQDLTEQEQRLLGLIRDGRVDAEIAVRLGISNVEAKERIEQLGWKMRARDRAALRDGGADPETSVPSEAVHASHGRGRDVPIVALTAVVLLALAAGALAGWWLRGDGEPPVSAVVVGPTAEPPPLIVTLTPTPTTPPSTIDGRQMHDAGQLFVQRPSLQTARVSNRESLVVVQFAEAAVIRYGDGPVQWRYTGGGPQFLSLSGHVGSVTVLLALVAQEGTQFLFGDDDSVGVYSRSIEGPSLILWVQAPEGPAYYHAELLPDGHLYIAAEDIPANAAVAYDTGELLDHTNGGQTLPTGIVPIGDTIQADHWILCGNGTHCTSILRGDFVTRAGTLECDEQSQTLTFTTASTTKAILTFKWERPATPLQCREAIRAVVAGEALGYGGIYSVSATTLDGTPLSVLITRHGVIYLSSETPKFGCPCRTGS